MHTNLQKLIYSIIALALIPISGLATDIYVPSLPAVSAYFACDKSLVQLSITSYLIGIGLMQLFGGGVTDSYGRRKPAILAMLLFIISTLAVTLSHNVYQLIIFRFLQGSAAAMTVVPLRAIILDLYEGRQLKKMTTYMTIAWSIGPIIAPVIGGVIQHYINWQANFYFLAIYSFIGLLFVWRITPETSKYQHHFSITELGKRYIGMLSSSAYLLPVFISGFLYSQIMLFSVIAPFLIQKVMHYSVIAYGNISLMLGVAWFLGTMTSRFLIDVPLKKLTLYILLSTFSVLMVMILLTLWYGNNIFLFIVPNIILVWLSGSLFPGFFSRAMSLFPTLSGSASALFGAITFFIAGLVSIVGALLPIHSVLIIALCYLGIFIIISVLAALDVRVIFKK